MKTVEITGYSDDCIEIDGDLREEWYSHEGGSHLAFSDGTVLHIDFDPDGSGNWRIRRIKTGTAGYALTEASDDDEDVYTDTVTLTGDIRWVVHGSEIAS